MDVIDQKILTVLIKNARVSTLELAKIINHNYPTVLNKLNKLIENGVIRTFYPILQFPGIGVRRYMGIYLKLKDISEQEQAKLIKDLAKNPFLIHVYELEGAWNIFLLLTTNYIKEARDTMDLVKQRCGESLVSFILMPTFTISPLNRKFFLEIDFEVKHEDKVPLVHLERHVKLDEKDIKILDCLRLNAKIPLDDLAEASGLQSSALIYRLNRYIKLNLIRYFSIDIDPEVLGYSQYLLFLNLQGNTQAKESLIKYLKENVKQAYHYFEYIGHWEIVVTFCVKSRQEMEEIKNEIMNKFREQIKNHEILWVKKRYKFDPYPEVRLVYPKN
ncbi:Lrp/AsnC family transcriptional regulator [Candidatus Woesearchaeota archaeon]|nr:Lrp/AsnC family transcriptional regulator [Candidatus Woesearchaeota archaeon]